MIKGDFPIEQFKGIKTPFYYYDTQLLQETIDVLKSEIDKYGYCQHYAVKANSNPRILKMMADNGFGADCVSGGEIKAALEAGFSGDQIVYAGVGKDDWEINLGLDANIFSFNVESLAELRVINELAAKKNKTANIALRINPHVDAKTHAKITTGLAENKFGINYSLLEGIFAEMSQMRNVKFIGIHLHIGSQITDMKVFYNLCERVNHIMDLLEEKGIRIDNLNLGGGLGIDYYHPNHLNIANFKEYFGIINKELKTREGQTVHFELGRAVVAQCGSLISKVLYVKEGEVKKFAILDAGLTELIRPAMYDSYHRTENLSSTGEVEKYDVVGPICESSDVFGKDVELNKVKRGDTVVFRSAGAYGEVMSSQYNLRELAKSIFSEDLI